MGAVYSAINILVEAMTEPETGASSEVYSDQEKSADSELGVHCSYSDNTDTSTSAKLVRCCSKIMCFYLTIKKDILIY